MRRTAAARWVSGALGAAPRAAVPGARRLADGLSACRSSALPCVAAGELSARSIAAPIPMTPAATAAAPRAVLRSTGARVTLRGTGRATPRRRAAKSAGAVRTALRRAARRPSARLPAAGRRRRGLSRPRRRDRGDRRARLGMPVHVEGYTPPFDPRLERIKVTPDPGVIEVNIHPARDLGRAVEHHHGALRGGAAAPARHREVHARRPPHRHRRRQPRHARRPDAGRQPVPAPARPAAQPGRLLAEPPVAVATCSPACSSARPARRRASTRRATTASTSWRSPSPRCPTGADGHVPPWLVDRLFRNLLVDVTGNTHRAEFCIDKLYSPDGPTGRLGLVEFRALRDAAARADEPRAAAAAARARRPLLGAAVPAAAGALGHATARPLHAAALRLAGLSRRARRPARRRLRRSTPTGSRRTSSSASRSAARSRMRGIAARAAPGARALARARRGGRRGGTARYVDSSLERVQVKVTRHDRRPPRRHLQRPRACRCIRPARSGEFVAGVRYRAWQPPRALHPTIPVAHAAGLRPGRHLERALARRLHLPRRPSGRPQLRDVPGQRLRGRGPPRRRASSPSATRRGSDADAAARGSRIREFPLTLDLRRSR